MCKDTLDVANPSARVALLGSDSAGRGAGGRLVTGLAAVITQTLVRSAILRDVAHYTLQYEEHRDYRRCSQLPHLKHPFLEN